MALALLTAACTSSNAGDTSNHAPAAGAADATDDCLSIAGAHQLLNSDGIGASYHPWILFEQTNESWQAVVSLEGGPGHVYDVTMTADALDLKPVDRSAYGEWSDYYSYWSVDWERIRLNRQGACLTGTGSAQVYEASGGFEQSSESSVETVSVTVASPEPAVVEKPQPVLPWNSVRITTSRPVPSLAEHIALPSQQWQAADPKSGDATGITTAMLSFSGDWNDINGESFSLTIGPQLVDLGGLPLQDAPKHFAIVDVGLALASHDANSHPTVATWGGAGSHPDGLALTDSCHEQSGIAGRLDTTGKAQVVLQMRLFSEFGVPEPLWDWRVDIIAEDGSLLPLISDGNEPTTETGQWVYDVAGHARVGFSIEVHNTGLTVLGECAAGDSTLLIERVFSRGVETP